MEAALPVPPPTDQALVSLVRDIVHHEGGVANPSSLHTLKDGTQPYLRLDEMLQKRTLLNFLEGHADEFEVLRPISRAKRFDFRLQPGSDDSVVAS